MTPPAATTSRQPNRRPTGRVLVLHRQGRSWRVLVAQTSGSGAGADAAGVSILDARTLPADGPDDALAPLLREHKPTRVIRIIPSAATICRATTLPEGAPDEVAAALDLLAEAELPAAIPAHRRAGGVLHPGGRSAPPLALLVGWPDRASSEADPVPDFPLRAQLWIPEPVALAALAEAAGGAGGVGGGGGGGGGGGRIALHAERETGSVDLLATGPSRSLARIFRADTSSDAAWRSSIAAAVGQLAAAVGASPADAPASDGPLHLSPPGVPRIPGIQNKPDWLHAYGLALGAAIAYAAPDPARDALLSLRPHPDNGPASLPERLIAALSTPARAAAVILLCVALLLLVPLGVAAARASALERQAGGTDALAQRLEVADREAAFYDLLRARRWPMTKLLADVAGAAPIGVRVDVVELSPDQGPTGLVVRGTAPSADAVTDFARNLFNTRVVADIATPSIAAEGLGVMFQLQARVAAPLFRSPPAHDYAEQTLAQRMYGEAASRIRYTEVADEPRADRRRADAPRAEPRDAEARPRQRETAAAAPPPAPPPAEVPPALTDEEIAAMDRAAVMREFGNRRRASTQAPAGSEDRQRLEQEVEKLRHRLQELRSGGGS